jgi:Arc/MetJ-type ribon-helix-helix transcriptional regulator
MTFALSLPPDLKKEIRKRLESGRYASIDEIICEALRLFVRYERVTEDCLKLLEHETKVGISRFAFWEYTELAESALAEVRAEGTGKLRGTRLNVASVLNITVYS